MNSALKSRLRPQEYLRGGRVVLQRLAPNPETAQMIFDTVHLDRIRLSHWLKWVDGTQTAQNSLDWLIATNARWDEGVMFDFGMFDAATGAWMGNIGLHSVSHENESAEIGYWIAGTWEGRGFISDAVLTLEREAFTAGFHRLRIRCDARNVRSALVPQRCGWRFEGIQREDAFESSGRGIRRSTLAFARLATDSSDRGISDFLAITGQIVLTQDLSSDLEDWKRFLALNPIAYQRDQVCFEVGSTRLVLLDAQFPNLSIESQATIPLWFVLDPERTAARLVAAGARVVDRVNLENVVHGAAAEDSVGREVDSKVVILISGRSLIGLWRVI
jgi:ribosomal-protein-serine acetyltransferase